MPAIPKPTRQPKKVGNLSSRAFPNERIKALTTKATSDAAHFRPDDVRAVWREVPLCLITQTWQFVDLHHILGRGHEFGAIKRRADRAVFSSIYGCAPLCRAIHDGPYINNVYFRRFLFETVKGHIRNAIAAGRYEPRGEDLKFLTIAEEYFLTH